MTALVQCLPHNLKDPNLDLWYPWEMLGVVRLCEPVAGEAEAGAFLGWGAYPVQLNW